MAATKFPSVSDVNLKVLYKAIDVPEDAIIWCREHGLLKQHRPCDVCGRDMSHNISKPINLMAVVFSAVRKK